MKYEELEWFDWDNYKRPHNFKDLTGQENDNFKIIGRAPNITTGNKAYVLWNCLCKHCGEYCVKNTTNFNNHTSCGCTKSNAISKKLSKDLTGQTFGYLTALYRSDKKSNSCRHAIWHCRCICGQEIDVDSHNLTRLHTISCGCIKRQKSVGALNIETILKANNIVYKTEISFKDLIGVKKHPYFYDFGIYENNNLIRLIEFDGIQHYQDTWGKWAQSNHTLEEQQTRDKIKNEYALSHNIPLIRIPYWERDSITLDMIMGDEYKVK